MEWNESSKITNINDPSKNLLQNHKEIAMEVYKG